MVRAIRFTGRGHEHGSFHFGCLLRCGRLVCCELRMGSCLVFVIRRGEISGGGLERAAWFSVVREGPAPSSGLSIEGPLFTWAPIVRWQSTLNIFALSLKRENIWVLMRAYGKSANRWLQWSPLMANTAIRNRLFPVFVFLNITPIMN